MKYFTIDKTRNGYYIQDSIHNSKMFYYGYTLKQAIKEHRKNFNLQRKHFEKIYI